MPIEAILPNPEKDQALRYSPGILVSGEARTLYIAGQVGIDAAGTISPDFAVQATQTMTNLVGVLEKAGMGVGDLVKVTVFLTSLDDYKSFVEIRGKFLGAHKPASTLLVVAGLASPAFKVEVEAIAAVCT